MEKVSKALDIEATGIPYLVIGEDVVSGFAKDITERSIDKKINKCLTEDYQDIAGITLGVVEGKIDKNKKDNEKQEENNNKKDEDMPKVCLEMSELRWGICRFLALTCNVLFMIVLYCAMVDGMWVSAFADQGMMLR